MFGASGFGDTSGFGGIAVRTPELVSSPRPYGGWFDEAADALEQAFAGFSDPIERVGVHAGGLTLFVKREAIVDICRTMRYEPRLRYELCAGVSCAYYPDDPTGAPP